jgi:hypothetical protein
MGGVCREGWGKALRRVVALSALASLVAVQPVRAEEDESFLAQAGMGLGTGLVNVLYIPAKFTYAVVGSVIGGLAWVLTLGDTDTAMGVWEPTLGGSYVITPAMLRGDEPVEFSGEVSEPESDEYVEEVSEEVEIREYDTRPAGE